MTQKTYPDGWDERRVRSVLAHYELQSDADAAREDAEASAYATSPVRRMSVIRVFVSSPSDVLEERTLLDELAGELNASWSHQLALRLELLRWERDVLPGTGAEPQQVIDTAIADDYHVFIGVLWKSLGTPTTEHASGTVHEFERAFARAQHDPSLRIMMYFSDKPTSPSELDIEQLMLVKQFQADIGSRGVLWARSKDRNEFLQLARLHLAKIAQEWHGRVHEPSVEVEPATFRDSLAPPHRSEPDTSQDDEGLLDLAESIQEDLASLTSTAQRITEAIHEVGIQMTAGSEALDALRQQGVTDPSRIKRVLNRAAEDVEVFATRIDNEVPIFAAVYDRMVRTVARAAVIEASLDRGDDPLAATVAAARTLTDGLRKAKTGAEGMRNAAAAWPKMSTALHKSRRHAVVALDSLIAEFDKHIDLTTEVIESLTNRHVPSS